jgi:ABC-type Fe3+ transport system permease subunit
MAWLNRLETSQRSASGLEWSIWKRLPVILLAGTVAPLAIAAVAWFAVPSVSGGAEDPKLLLVIYQSIGLVILHWTLVFTVAIGCALVMVMKGPAFVADPYPPAGRESFLHTNDPGSL